MDSLAAESSTSKFVAERSAILGDIDVYLRRIINLKTHLNTFTHINRLPNEVLGQILVVYARDHYRSATRDRDKSGSTSPQWIKLAHVCRHWREVALGTPRFWSHVYVRRLGTFSALLSLSKSSPLHVDLTLQQYSCSDFGTWISATDLIGQESHRLREFICVANLKQFRTLGEKLSPPMRFLEMLALSESQWGDQDEDDSQPFHILPATGHTPRLRHLELRELPVVWTDPVFCPTLTTLVVTGKADQHAASSIGTGTFEQLLDALQAMAPSLVHLTLENSVPPLQSSTAEPPLPNRSIALTSLQTMSINCNTNDCVHLMDHLSINPVAKIDVTGSGGSGIQRLVEILSGHVSRSAPLLGLKISFPNRASTSKVTITGYEDTNFRRQVFDSDGGPPLNLTLSIPWTGGAQERPLTAVLKAAHKLFSRVQTLYMYSNVYGGFDVPWLTLFACAQSVQTLDISGHPGTRFFKALCDVRQVKGEQSSVTCVPLVRLRELKLGDVRFRDSMWRPNEHNAGKFFHGLLDWVILRCNYGIPLERLRLLQCEYATARDIRRIEQIVVQVEWDQWE
ncbi:hypothetical protein LXA43DRAFT_1177890 [Ganoderma leucocontextum]|nr:hypothetical protein LXA43DRAFT_1177890 [Ganoderma leucocontextum]